MDVEQLKNIGETSGRWLHEAGIHTRADLEEIGAVMAYKVIQHQRPGVNIMLLYALQAALMDIHWNALPPDLKEQLRQDAKAPLTVF